MTTSNAYNTGKIFDGYMGRNRIINGNCNIAQRGSVVASSGVASYGGPDRFFASNQAGAGQFTQSQGTITYNGVAKNAVVQTVNTAVASFTSGNYWYGIIQYMEGYNIYDFLGQQISVSFIFNTNVSGTYSMSLTDGSLANSYVTTFTATANTPTRYTFNIPTLSTSLVIPATNAAGLSIWIGSLNQGTYQTSIVNTWQSGNFISASGATNWGLTASNFIAVAELQIEEGAIVTPFEREAYGITYLKCQRYFQSAAGSTFVASGTAASTTFAYMQIPIGCQLRTTPTVSFTGTPQLYGSTAGPVNVASITTIYYSGSFLGVQANVASGLTVGQGQMFYTSTGTLLISSEY